MRVLLTGACGNVAQDAIQEFVQRYDCRLTDIRPYPGDPPAEYVQADLADSDAITRVCRGVDAIVHLGASVGSGLSLEECIGPNIIGTNNIFEAARQNGIKRVVFASTWGVVMGYGVNPDGVLDADVPVRPNSIYSSTKVWGEAMGRVYADYHGLSVICIRIGFPLPGVEAGRVSRIVLPLWVSPRDMTQLLWRAVEAPNIHFGIFYGISDNSRRFCELQPAREMLGYQPQDNAQNEQWRFRADPEDSEG